MLKCKNVANTSSTSIDQKVEDILSQMTLPEKAGQMTNISLMALAKGEFWDRRDTVELDTSKLRELLINYHVGSVQNLGTYPFDTSEWRKVISEVHKYNSDNSRLNIPVLYGIDAVHGANYTAGSTLLPHQLALAATWNPDLAKTAGEITSYEIKASGIPWNYAPVLDVSKQPFWGRIFETFGEDTYLATQMGNAFIEGSQGNDISDFNSSAVCLKHFLGYGQPYNGKDRSPTYLPERMLRQYYLPPFEAAIKQGALTVMLNSGSVNGIPSHADKQLITDILKGELKFEGFTISDWEDVVNLVKTHQVAKNEKEAVKLSVNAGLDMCMEPYDASFAAFLIELVNEGSVSIERVDDAVRRILKVKMKLGLFDKTMENADLYKDFGSKYFANKSLKAAEESITLLKNSNSILPLNKNIKVLVTGVGANSINYLNGAWSRTWGGESTEFNDLDKKTVLQAIQEKIGTANVIYKEGTDYESDINTNEAVNAATKADVAIVVLGEKPATEKPSDINDLEMPQVQLDLIKKLSTSNTPIILVLLEARPRLINKIEALVDGVLMAYLPGNEGGRAIANIIFGDVNPSGKLPLTYPRYNGSIWSYDHTKSDERDSGFGFDAFNPQYEFGFGLSYTTFKYENFNINQDTLLGSDSLKISVEITNTGKLPGKEVVQLFLTDMVASITPAVKQLKRFKKVNLNSSEKKIVEFYISKNDLSFVDQNNNWVSEEGDFQISIDTLSSKFYYFP
jgi:beta-glucosidase